MPTDDWFRNTKWDTKEKEKFFERLKRSKSNFHKAQYARIKAYHLFETGRKDAVVGAIELLKKTIKEWPEQSEMSQCYSQMAEAYSFLSNTEKALEFFEKCFDFEKKFRTIKTGVSLNYSEFIVKNNLVELYERAVTILQEDSKKKAHYLFPIQFFLYHGLRAILLKQKDMSRSKEEAKIALKYAEKDSSGLRYHKTLGLVPKTHWLLKPLKELVK